MPEDENTSSENVGGESDTDELPAASVPVVVTPASPDVQHVRIGGNAGVRVQQSALPLVRKVTGPDSPIADHKLVPCAVLAEVRQTLDDHTSAQLTAAERMTAVRDLLAPWL